MGLDMYLYIRKEKYESEYRGEIADVPESIRAIQKKFCNGSASKITSEDYQVAYWRKANHIHKFFVDTCARGVDECQTIYVDKENIQDLFDRCTKILLSHTTDKDNFEEVCSEELPTSEGFFFGSTGYDEYYLQDVQYTIDVCKNLLDFFNELPEDGSSGAGDIDWKLIYQASW